MPTVDGSIDIDLGASAVELLDELAKARAAKEAAACAEQETLAKVARDLAGREITQRDAAQLLGLSPQPVAQFPRDAPAATPTRSESTVKKVSAPKRRRRTAS